MAEENLEYDRLIATKIEQPKGCIELFSVQIEVAHAKNIFEIFEIGEKKLKYLESTTAVW